MCKGLRKFLVLGEQGLSSDSGRQMHSTPYQSDKRRKKEAVKPELHILLSDSDSRFLRCLLKCLFPCIFSIVLLFKLCLSLLLSCLMRIMCPNSLRMEFTPSLLSHHHCDEQAGVTEMINKRSLSRKGMYLKRRGIPLNSGTDSAQHLNTCLIFKLKAPSKIQ